MEGPLRVTRLPNVTDWRGGLGRRDQKLTDNKSLMQTSDDIMTSSYLSQLLMVALIAIPNTYV